MAKSDDLENRMIQLETGTDNARSRGWHVEQGGTNTEPSNEPTGREENDSDGVRAEMRVLHKQTTALINAMREDFIAHRTQADQDRLHMQKSFALAHGGIEDLHRSLVESERRFTGVDRRIDLVEARITNLDRRSDERFAVVGERFDRLDKKFDQGFAEMRGMLDAAATGQHHIATVLATLIDREIADKDKNG